MEANCFVLIFLKGKGLSREWFVLAQKFRTTRIKPRERRNDTFKVKAGQSRVPLEAIPLVE